MGFMCRKRHKIVCDGGRGRQVDRAAYRVRSYNTVVTVTVCPKKVRVAAGRTAKDNAVDVLGRELKAPVRYTEY